MDYYAPGERFSGDGFLLRTYRTDDGPQLREATLESYEHLKTFMPWATTEQSEEEAERLVRQFRGRWLLASDFTIAIVDPSDERTFLGGTGFHLRGQGFGTLSAEIGLWIRASAAGQGLGTRVLAAMLSWGFSDDWPWRRLTWHCDALNTASKHVAQKNGLRLEGELLEDTRGVDGSFRSSLRFAILKDEYLGIRDTRRDD